eukprot:jgi/Galph1/6074/GphlegSOOS_G4740.1
MDAERLGPYASLPSPYTPAQHNYPSPLETPRENRKQLMNVFLSGGGVPQQPSGTSTDGRFTPRGDISIRRPWSGSQKTSDERSLYSVTKSKESKQTDSALRKGRAPPRTSLLEDSEQTSDTSTKEYFVRSPVSPEIRNFQGNTEEHLFSPREDSSNTWITVFGFGPSLQAAVLREFRNYGDIVNYIPGKGNWLHLCYKTPLQAQIALGKRIHTIGSSMIVGSVPCIEPDLVRGDSVWSLSNSREEEKGVQTSISRLHGQATTAHNLFVDGPRPAREEWLLKEFSESILLFYCNSPCVVIGRNQNLLKEVNLELIQSEKIPVARRRTGGGCVYHDKGNLNISLITNKKDFSRGQLAEFIQSVLRNRFNIPVTLSERNDLYLLGKKIAGSAYRLTGFRAYHHMSLLISADLFKLENVLKLKNSFSVETKATQSIRSKVCNLTEFLPSLTKEDISQALQEEMVTTKPVSSVTKGDMMILQNDNLRQLSEEAQREYEVLKSSSWIVGESPPFSLVCKMFFRWGYLHISLRVKKGNIIEDVGILSSSGIPSTHQNYLVEGLLGLECFGDIISAKLTEKILQNKETSYNEVLMEISNWFLRNFPWFSMFDMKEFGCIGEAMQ